METIDKLNYVIGWLSAMAFDKPELSNDLENPLNYLSEAISEVENLSLSGVSQQRELLEWLSNEDYFNIPKDEISEILEDWQTYNSNCG